MMLINITIIVNNFTTAKATKIVQFKTYEHWKNRIISLHQYLLRKRDTKLDGIMEIYNSLWI